MSDALFLIIGTLAILGLVAVAIVAIVFGRGFKGRVSPDQMTVEVGEADGRGGKGSR
jgi:ABC-type transporter Mla subunit MlaD